MDVEYARHICSEYEKLLDWTYKVISKPPFQKDFSEIDWETARLSFRAIDGLPELTYSYEETDYYGNSYMTREYISPDPIAFAMSEQELNDRQNKVNADKKEKQHRLAKAQEAVAEYRKKERDKAIKFGII